MKSPPVLISLLSGICLSMMTPLLQARVHWNYASLYDYQGTPTDLGNIVHKLPDDLLPKIYDKLPERRHIDYNNQVQVTNDQGANLKLLEDAEVEVVFLAEGAGYRNSIGYFTFNDAMPPSNQNSVDPTILFPNFSGQGSGGGLEYGDSVNLGVLEAGTSLGLYLVSNGWRSNWNGVNPWPPQWGTFTTLKGTNPEPESADNLNAHTILLVKDDSELLVVGLEDINRTFGHSDHDFNDAIIGIKVSPFSAIDRTHTQSFNYEIDSDGDGIPDYIDLFPNDPVRAQRHYFPSAEGWGRLAFEDNWPTLGDFDMNDLVVSYRTVETRDRDNRVTDISLIYRIDARGALLHNGFGVHLPGVSPNSVVTRSQDADADTSIKIGNSEALDLAPEPGQSETVFIVADDTLSLTDTSNDGCGFFNTITTCPQREPVRIQLDIEFAEPLDDFPSAPFNPFLFRTNYRGLEIHLVDHEPTDLADPGLFQTYDDYTEPDQGRFFRSEFNLPWAIDIPYGWQHPAESRDISESYLNFGPWVESGGTQYTDWYGTQQVDTKLFPLIGDTQ